MADLDRPVNRALESQAALARAVAAAALFQSTGEAPPKLSHADSILLILAREKDNGKSQS